MLPSNVEVDEIVAKVRAEALNGSFTLLPRHVDFAAALRQGLLLYTLPNGRENVLAVDGGTLVKVGDEVLVATPRAIRGRDLASVRAAVEERFRQLDERERVARSVLERIGGEIVERMVELEELSRRG